MHNFLGSACAGWYQVNMPHRCKYKTWKNHSQVVLEVSIKCPLSLYFISRSPLYFFLFKMFVMMHRMQHRWEMRFLSGNVYYLLQKHRVQNNSEKWVYLCSCLGEVFLSFYRYLVCSVGMHDQPLFLWSCNLIYLISWVRFRKKVEGICQGIQPVRVWNVSLNLAPLTIKLEI